MGVFLFLATIYILAYGNTQELDMYRDNRSLNLPGMLSRNLKVGYGTNMEECFRDPLGDIYYCEDGYICCSLYPGCCPVDYPVCLPPFCCPEEAPLLCGIYCCDIESTCCVTKCCDIKEGEICCGPGNCCDIKNGEICCSPGNCCDIKKGEICCSSGNCCDIGETCCFGNCCDDTEICNPRTQECVKTLA